MDERAMLVNMLRQLLKEMEIVSSQGAGYYTCVPFAQRYNKLMMHAKELYPSAQRIMSTFDTIVETDPKDPSDKSKVLLGIRVEISQLITLLESIREEGAA